MNSECSSPCFHITLETQCVREKSIDLKYEGPVGQWQSLTHVVQFVSTYNVSFGVQWLVCYRSGIMIV